MCIDCLKEEFPDRDNVCLDNGSYVMNYSGCSQCGDTTIKISNRIVTENAEEEEQTTYQHICSSCSHVIANHEHNFRVENSFQVYEMLCSLCGNGEDERSIMPWDPRGPKD